MKKRTSLVSSLIAIVICFSMLLGTTYAWFTDSIVNTNNIIKSGNVDVELWHKSNSDTEYSEVDGTTKLFKNVNGGDILWEVGSEATETFKIANAGSLSLKYDFRIKAVSKTANANGEDLTDVLNLKVEKVVESGNEEKYNKLFDKGTSVNGSLAPNDYDEYVVTVHFAPEQENVNYNDFEDLKLLLGIELVATQYNAEYDGNGNTFDETAQFPNVSSNVNFSDLTQNQDVVLETKGENAVSTKLPTDLVDELKNKGFDSVSLVHTDPIVEDNKITFESIELVDEDGNVIDLSANDEPITVTLPLSENFGAEEGAPVDIYHDDEKIATGYVENNTITYKALHFCKVSVEKFDAIKVSTADELIEALGDGKSVLLTADITISANQSNAYGKTGINVLYGQSIFGNNKTLTVTGANGTWDTAISTTGGLIRDLTINGGFRGVFVNHNSEQSSKVILENVKIEKSVYTMNCDQGTNKGFEATNCTFNGWLSFAATIGEVKFIDCYFGEGSGYAFCQPYIEVNFVGCTFEVGYEMNPLKPVTFENCTIGGVSLTTENLETLVTSNIANATVKEN